MAKYRSNLNFAAAYNSDKQGYASGNENFVFLKREVTPGLFTAPSIPTQGSSVSGATASVDISGGTNTSVRLAVDGNAPVTATLSSVVGLSSGALIAAALETALNAALALAGQDSRVYVLYESSVYKIRSQKAGLNSKVVVSAAASNDLAPDLKLGLANTGTESVGANGTDFLYVQKASMKVNQEFEASKHREGRQVGSVIKKKIMAEGDFELYVNFDTSGPSPKIDPALALLLEGVFGRKTETASEIVFDSADPSSLFFSALQVNNAFARSMNGGYVKNFTLSLPGDGEASIKMSAKFRDGKYAGAAKVQGAVVASPTVTLEAGESESFEKGSRVMVVAPDGRTILAGMDGNLSVLARADALNQLSLSAPVSVEDEGFVVAWAPNVLGTSGIDNPATGLQGSVSFDGGATLTEEIRSAEITFDPKEEDLDAYYGADGNRGRVVADKSEIKCKIEVNLTGANLRRIIQIREEKTFAIRIVLGEVAGRHLELVMPKVRFPTPDVEIPDNGTVAVSLDGMCLQTAPGAHNAIRLAFK